MTAAIEPGDARDLLMKTILVVDDLPIFREPMEAALSGAGYSVMSAVSGADALARMTHRKPDLVVLDLGMPGMDGLQVLAAMRRDGGLRSVPVLILSASADRVRVIQAAKLGIAGYMLKSSFSLKELLSKVSTVIGASSAPPEMAPATGVPLTEGGPGPQSAPPRSMKPERSARPLTPSEASEGLKSLKPVVSRAELLERLRSADDLKGFSPIVSQVLSMVSNDRSSLEAVAKAIGNDQALALKILKVANSCVYTRGERVDTVHKAVLRIGVESLRQTVINIGVVERFSSAAFSEHISTEQFWEHSIACGLIAADIAHACRSQDADTAFTSGLIHDLGRVIFAETLGRDYVDVIETARRLRAPLEAVESRLLLLNHAEVMDRLLLSWKFPKQLIEPIMHHHVSVGNSRNVAPARVQEIWRLALADRLAHAMLLGDSGNELIYPTHEHCRALQIGPEALRAIELKAQHQTDEAKFALLSNSGRGAWSRRSEDIKRQLPSPFAPLFVGPEPELDAYRLFCTVLSDPEVVPNLIVAHVPGAKDRELVSGLLESRASEAHLPLIVLSPAAQWGLPESLTASRASVLLPTPLSVAAFVETATRLLERDSRFAA